LVDFPTDNYVESFPYCRQYRESISAQFRTQKPMVLTVIDRLVTRLGPRINQHAHFRLEHPSDGVEQPPMRIDLLFVFLFEHKDDLDRDEVVGVP
jgi:hypothetical protein